MGKVQTKWCVAVCLLLSGCGYNVNVQGVDIKQVTKQEILPALAGAATAFVIHELGHLMALEAKGYDYEFHGTEFTYNGNDSTVQRAGFAATTLTGAILNIIPATRSHAFTLGFNSASFAGALTYPIRHGDGGDHQGDTKEWMRDSFLTTGNLIWTIDNRRRDALRDHVRQDSTVSSQARLSQE